MYSAFRQTCERLLRIPHDPAPPPGDEASTRIFRAAPNYYRYLFLIWALKTAFAIFIVVVALVVPLAAASFAMVKQGQGWGVLLVLLPLLVLLLDVLGCLFNLAVLRLEYEKRWYVITDRSLRVREGVVTVREMTVNFANIQNISISQGPIQRALGIADLRVDTAGGGGAASQHSQHQPTENLHTAWFRGVSNAGQVRELIQQRLRLLKDSGLGDHEELSRPAPSSARQAASLCHPLSWPPCGKSTPRPELCAEAARAARQITVKIPIIEDDAKTARAIRQGLRGEGYEAVVATTGEEGFFQVNAEAFDLVALAVAEGV